MKNAPEKLPKWKAHSYCRNLEKQIICLNLAGRYEEALKILEERIAFGKKYAPRITRGKKLDALEYACAAYLVKLGRYEEAIQHCPRINILNAIVNEQKEQGRNVSQLDVLPLIQTILDSANALDPSRRCPEEDYDYARRWLSNFYISRGDYVESLAIEMEDILNKKIGKKESRSAVESYLTFAKNALALELYDYAKTALVTAFRMATKVLNKKSDLDAELYYNIYICLFHAYLGLNNLGEADFALSCGLEFLKERTEQQKRTNKEKKAVDQIAREKIIHSKAISFLVQEKYEEALEFSDWTINTLKKRKAKSPEKDETLLDQFYLEVLTVNICCILSVNNGRTLVSDAYVLDMIREMVHIADELESLTLGTVRKDFIKDIQYDIDFVFSYCSRFSDHTISAEALYHLELIIKNIDADIYYFQNKIAQQSNGTDSTVTADYRNWQAQYQRALFEHPNVPAEYKELQAEQRRLEIKQYHLLKQNEYEFPHADPQILQMHLADHMAILEFRRITRFDGKKFGQIQMEDWYCAFWVSRDQILFETLLPAQEIDAAIKTFLSELLEQSALDAENIIGHKLMELEAMLLKPFRAKLLQTEELYIIPDDELYKIPFEIMPMMKEACHATDIRIAYLASARSILRNAELDFRFRNIKIVANPKFRIEEAAVNENNISETANEDMPDRVCGVLRQAIISPLKYTKLEAELIANTFTAHNNVAEIIQGIDARKNNIFQPSADILHFATHGYALALESSAPKSSCKNRWKQIAGSVEGLHRCGLLLAGVDNWLSGKEVNGFGNGILTGWDILSENLSGYKLAVLSACDTGQNVAADGGDGLEGLRSAFELAGIPLLICSLWRVDDFATALFMAEFYQELHQSDPLSALNAAKYKLRNMTYSELVQRGFEAQANIFYKRQMALSMEERPFAHPKYWAGFIMHGTVFSVD